MNEELPAPMEQSLSTGQLASMACLIEATTVKPGNVHRGADFEDLNFFDFVASTVVIGPIFDRAEARGVGSTVLDAARATRNAVATNTNLGTLLLLAPMAVVPRHDPLREGVAKLLQTLTANDSQLVYEAIRLAQPGGLGQQPEADVAGEAPNDLLHAMRLAAERDTVARQYGNGFTEVFDLVVPSLQTSLRQGWSLEKSIIHTQLQVLAEHPDSLIARKCGLEIAGKTSWMASRVLGSGKPGDVAYERELGDLDFWMRSDHHHRNPGTTADLIAAGLFVALRENIVQPPYKLYDSR